MKAYPYIRYSTKDQEWGDSERRQRQVIEDAREWLEELGYELDWAKAYIDRGKSGQGEHKRTGDFGRFLKDVKEGRVKKGSMLVVENQDRLSREHPDQAMHQILDLKLNYGIIVGFADKRKAYGPDQHWSESMGLFVGSGLASDDVNRRVDKQKSTWSDKREKKDKVHRAPKWLKMNYNVLPNGKKVFVSWEILSGAKETIRSIFRMKIHGTGPPKNHTGSETIAKKLNEDRLSWKPFKKDKVTGKWVPGDWRKSYVQKILSDIAVLGWYQPHKLLGKKPDQKRVPDGEVDRNHYPAILNEEEKVKYFDTVQLRLKENRNLGKGHGGGRRGKNENLFTNIIKCHCGASMHYGSGGPSPEYHPRLQCRNSAEGVRDRKTNKRICNAPRVRYDTLEIVILNYIKEHLDLDLFQDQPGERTRRIDELRDKIEIQVALQVRLSDQVQTLLDELENTSPQLRAVLKNRITRRENERIESKKRETEYRQQLDELEREKRTAKDTATAIKTLDELRVKARSEGRLSELNHKLNLELRRLITLISVRPLKGEGYHLRRQKFSSYEFEKYQFESVDVAHIGIQFKYKKLTKSLVNRCFD